ncbi:MAG: hypothetical protein AAGD38_11155 [Acidobacteriota bacterium]
MKALLVATLLTFVAVSSFGVACPDTIHISNTTNTYANACPTPSLTKSWAFTCTDGCGHTSPATANATAEGECRTIPALCSAVCLPRFGGQQNIEPWFISASLIEMKVTGLICPFSCKKKGDVIVDMKCNCDADWRPADCLDDPLLFSFDDDELSLTDVSRGVEFDHDGDGFTEPTAWTAARAREAFLVLDRDGNGWIDNGLEIFGDETSQPTSDDPNGFRALAVFDDALSGGNEDGRISADDRIFDELELWFDTNHDGRSQENELMPLGSHIVSIDLGYWPSTEVDRHGHLLAYRSVARGTNQIAHPVWNVFFNNH